MKRRSVTMKMDEIFFNEFGIKKKELIKKLGVTKLSDKDFSKILINSKAINFNGIKLLKNEKCNKRKKRKLT